MGGSNNCTACQKIPLEIWTSFLVENVLIPVLSGLGLVGNILAIVVLRNPGMKSTFHQSLIALASCDIMFLSLIILDYSENISSKFYIIIFPYFLNPMKNILLCWGTFLTMSITTERFLAVCKPLLYRTHKLRYSTPVHLLTYILPPVFISLILNIPKFLEAKFIVRNKTDSQNITFEVLDFSFTQLRLNPTYIYYYTHWTRLICTGIVPFFYLLLTNTCIFITMRRSKKSFPKVIFQCSNNGKLFQKRKYPQKSSITLVAIVVLYLICNTPRLLLNCVEYHYFSFIMDGDFCECSRLTFFFELLLIINHLSLVINSSANILIYFSISKIFKKKLLHNLRFNYMKSVKSCSEQIKTKSVGASNSFPVFTKVTYVDKINYTDSHGRRRISFSV